MSKIIKVKITEVAQVLRTRIVELEAYSKHGFSGWEEDLKGKFDYDNLKDKIFLDNITTLVREQCSHEEDMTEQVIRAEIL